MAKKTTKKRYKDEYKRAVVKQFLKDAKKDKNLTVAQRSEELLIGKTIFLRWVKDPRYGGDPKFTTRGRRRQVISALPTEKVKYRKARPLVPTRFACPHCGGPVQIGGNHA